MNKKRVKGILDKLNNKNNYDPPLVGKKRNESTVKYTKNGPGVQEHKQSGGIQLQDPDSED